MEVNDDNSTDNNPTIHPQMEGQDGINYDGHSLSQMSHNGLNAIEPTELVVLDPDHPLMKRFQESLKNMLLKHSEQAEINLRQKDEELKRIKEAHIQTGCRLYGFQQELARFQVQLEKKHEEYTEIKEKSTKAKENLDHLKEEYNGCSKVLTEDTRRMHSMRDEVDAMCLRLYYLNRAKTEMSGDILVLKRAADKASGDLIQYQDGKVHQDILVDRLQAKVDQLKEDIALYEAQITSQESEIGAGMSILQEAEAQIIAIQVDKKHLMSQWNTSLLGLQGRNKAYASLTNAYNEQKDKLLVLQNEQVAYRRSIKKEQEKHEQLTVLLNKNEADLNTMKKQVAQLQSKYESDKQAYGTYSRMLQETERNLTHAQGENAAVQSAVERLRKEIEKEELKKTELEAKVSAELQERLTAKKAVEYAKKINITLKDQSRELISQVTQLENQISRDELAAAKQRAVNIQLQEKLKQVEEEITERNALINKMEAEIHRATIMVERKQSAIDGMSKQLETLLREAGGEELGPLDAMINNLTKAVAVKMEEIGDLEQQWLREQDELVKSVNGREALTEKVTWLNKQLSMLLQKRMRVDNDIAIQERNKRELERELRNLQNDMVRLNALIAKEKVTGGNLINENKLAETDFLRAMREKVSEVTELQGKVDAVRKEKDELLSELIEVERTIMLWEKRVQLCDETRKAVDCDLGKGELRVMRHEIHRMEVRKTSLLQQQEKLMQALERSVSKRDTIISQSEVQRNNKNPAHIRITAQRNLDDLRKKVKATKQMYKACTNELSQMEEKVRSMDIVLADKRSTVESEQKRAEELSDRLQQLVDEKQMNLFELQMKQYETVYWEQVRDGRYRRLCSTQSAISAEMTRQTNRMRSLLAIIDKLTAEFPKIYPDLAIVRKVLEKRLQAITDNTVPGAEVEEKKDDDNASTSDLQLHEPAEHPYEEK